MKKILEWVKSNVLLLLSVGLVLYLVVFPNVDIPKMSALLPQEMGGVGRKVVVEGQVLYDVMSFEPQAEDEWMRIKFISADYEIVIESTEGMVIGELVQSLKSGQDIPVKVADEMLLLAKPEDKISMVCKEGDKFFFDCKLNEYIFE